jgi:hypothetical protein
MFYGKWFQKLMQDVDGIITFTFTISIFTYIQSHHNLNCHILVQETFHCLNSFSVYQLLLHGLSQTSTLSHLCKIPTLQPHPQVFFLASSFFLSNSCAKKDEHSPLPRPHQFLISSS